VRGGEKSEKVGGGGKVGFLAGVGGGQKGGGAKGGGGGGWGEGRG